MKKHFSQLIAVALVVSLLASMLTVSVFADGGTEPSVVYINEMGNFDNGGGAVSAVIDGNKWTITTPNLNSMGSNGYFAIPVSTLKTNPYLTLDISTESSAQATIYYNFASQAGSTSPVFLCSVAETNTLGVVNIDTTADIASLDETYYLYIFVYVVDSTGSENIIFNSISCSETEPPVPAKEMYLTANDGSSCADDKYFLKNAEVTVTAGEGNAIKVQASAEGRLIYAYTNTFFADYGYLSYKIDEATAANLSKIEVTHYLDVSPNHSLSVEAGEHCYNIADMIKDDATNNYTYICIYPAATSTDAILDFIKITNFSTVDFEELENEIALSEALDLVNYIDDEALATFKAKLEAAQNIIANSSASQKVIDDAAVELKNAREALTLKPDPLNLEELKKQIELSKELDLTDYIDDEALATFKAKLEAAEALTEKSDAVQKDIDDAAAELKNAREALNVKVDPSALEEAIRKYNNYSKTGYTAETLKAFNEKLEEAKALIEKGATQKEIDDMVTALDNAAKALVPKASGNVTLLKPTKTSGDYTDGGFLEANAGFSAVAYGNCGIKATYTGGNFAGAVWAVPSSMIKDKPYLIFEIDNSVAKSEDVKFSLGVGYAPQEVELFSHASAKSVNGAYAFDLRDLLASKEDKLGYVYVGFYVISQTEQSIELSRFYLSSSDSDKTLISLPFLSTPSTSYTDGGYYALGDGMKVEGNGDSGLTITGGESRVLYAFTNAVVSSAPYLIYEIEGDASALVSLNLTKLWDDEEHHLLEMTPGRHVINIKDLLKDDETIGYTYLAITVNNGSVKFKTLMLSDGGVSSSPNTGDININLVVFIAFISLVSAAAVSFASTRLKTVKK